MSRQRVLVTEGWDNPIPSPSLTILNHTPLSALGKEFGQAFMVTHFIVSTNLWSVLIDAQRFGNIVVTDK